MYMPHSPEKTKADRHTIPDSISEWVIGMNRTHYSTVNVRNMNELVGFFAFTMFKDIRALPIFTKLLPDVLRIEPSASVLHYFSSPYFLKLSLSSPN